MDILSTMCAIKTLDTAPKPELPGWVKFVQKSVDSVNFGVIQIVVHNAKVVQIEKTEKLRLENAN